MSAEIKLVLVAEELAERVVTKEAIRQAIITKGTSVPAGTALLDYPTKISEITTSGILPAIVEAIFDEINGEVIPGDYVAKSNATIADKEAIRLAIVDKGVATPIDTHLQDYPAKIGEIVTGIPESIINPILDGINGEVVAGDYVAKSDAIAASKEAVRLAIVAKGVAVPVETELDVYPAKIAAIQTPVVSAVKVTYIDVEGTIIKEESGPVGFTSTPPSLSLLKTYYLEDGVTILAAHNNWIGSYTNVTEDRVIGMSYLPYTDDTNVFIHLDALTMSGLLTPIFNIYSQSSQNIRCYFGDGTQELKAFANGDLYGFTHTYANYGDYRVAFVAEGSLEFKLGLITTSYNFLNPTYGKCLQGIMMGRFCKTMDTNTLINCSMLKYIIFSNAGGTKTINTITGCHSLRAIIIPAGYSRSLIVNGNFYNCYNLQYIAWDITASYSAGYPFANTLESLELMSVTIPSSATEALSAYQCYSIRKITVPEGKTIIQNQSYFSSKALCYIKLPTTLTTIGTSAFDGTLLTTLDIPASVTTISGNIYSTGKYALRTIIVRAVNPPTLAAGTYTFVNLTYCHIGLKIYVPDASVNTYKAAAGWIQYASKIFALSTYVP